MNDTAFKSFLRFVYHRAFRAQLRLRCWFSDRAGDPPGLAAPLPPSLLRFRVSESISKSEFLAVGKGCAEKVEAELAAFGCELGAARRVLDFGCGCGRILRWLVERFPRTEFHGADVDAGAIEWCARNLSRGHFAATSAEPPLPYPAEHFDVIYCFSVFTHLNEAMQDRWLDELRRILRPGGVLLITVHGLRTAEASLGGGLGGALDRAALRELERAGIVHRTSKKLTGIVPEWYHTTWHTEEYIVARLGREFAEVRYRPVPDGMQDLVLARRSPQP